MARVPVAPNLGDDKGWATSVCYQREWLAKALRAGTPVLGICYGAQLLAAYLEHTSDGKPLSKLQTKEHCGVLTEIAVEGEGRSDPVVGHFVVGALVTQYHEDAFREPPGAIALSWSKEHSYRHCEAFRAGGPEAAVYGLQFHPAPTLQMLRAEAKHERWFRTIPPLANLRCAVQAGEHALRARIELATARRVERCRATD